MSGHYYKEPEGGFESFMNLALLLLALVLLGAWLVSKWLTEYLLRLVVNPWLNFVLDRHDGLTVLISAGLWAVIGGCVYPVAVDLSWIQTDFLQFVQGWLVFIGLGLGWGASIGAAIVLTWWAEAEQLEVSPNFAGVLGLPSSFYEPSEPNVHQLEEPKPEELEGMILGVEWAER